MPDFSTKAFLDALARLQGKSLLPTSSGTYGLEQLPADLRERAFFSARVVNADILQQAYDLISRGVSGGDHDAAGNYVPGSSVNLSAFRNEMKQYLQSIDYRPESGTEGTLQDLSSDKRLEVIYRTNVEMAQGYGTYLQQQDPASLDAYPAQELYRLEDRKERRPWGQRWNAAIQQLGISNTSAIPVHDSFANEGMFALVNDPIWTTISRFGLPYPPFDFGSGMWVRDVSRREAQDLGLLAPGDAAPDPDMTRFNQGMQAYVGDLAPALQEALSAFGSIVDGIFHIANSIANEGTSEGAIKGWVTRRGGSWTPAQKASAANGIRAISEIISSHKDIEAAMHRSDLGPIDFKWGDSGKGIAHIIEHRKRQMYDIPKRFRLTPKTVLNRIVVTIAKGKISRNDSRKISIRHKGYLAILAKTPGNNNWVLSGYREEK